MDAKKQFVYFYFQGGFRLRFVGVFLIVFLFCWGFCYFLLYILLFIIFVIHIFLLQGLDFDTAKKVRF